MTHVSVPVEATCELLNFTPVNPLISKCEVKVCYVGENRNKSLITREVATEMAKSLPGSPIVGYFNHDTNDFDGHTRQIDTSKGKFEIVDMTKPYGFVDMNARVWFQKFLDDGVEHEYLVTEGYVWSEIYPEAKRITEKGNNQSMELDENSLKGNWAFDDKGKPTFFIINEALIKKLCILGEDVEPCFEGARIAAEFSFDDNFKNTIYSAIKEIQLALQEGGNTQMDENKMNAPVENEADTEFKKKPEEEEEKKENESSENSEDNSGSEDKGDSDKEKKDDEKPAEGEDEEDEKKKKKFSLEEIPEYVDLKNNYSALEQKYNELVDTNKATADELDALKAEIEPLRSFKLAAERKDKEAMIANFYMLSEDDKKDIVANIDNYSLHDIEAELAILCFRNKVNFNLDEDKKDAPSNPVTYNLDDSDNEGDTAPAWIKAVRDTQKNRNQ